MQMLVSIIITVFQMGPMSLPLSRTLAGAVTGLVTSVAAWVDVLVTCLQLHV